MLTISCLDRCYGGRKYIGVYKIYISLQFSKECERLGVLGCISLCHLEKTMFGSSIGKVVAIARCSLYLIYLYKIYNVSPS